MSAPDSLTAELAERGYTHRAPTDDERRQHSAGPYARAILDASGACVAVLTARQCEAWIAEVRR